MHPSGIRQIPAENAPALYASSVVLALAIHAGVLYGWKTETPSLGAMRSEVAQTEVELFETAAQNPADLPRTVPFEKSASLTPSQELPPPAPRLEPPSPTEPPPEMALPTPSPPPIAVREPPPAQEPVPEPPSLPPQPAPVRPPSLARSTAPAKTGLLPESGNKRGDLADKTLGKPVYKVAPVVKYPAESRVAGEQGTVVLRIRVNAEGKPVEVTVLTSSGFPRLDRAAVEGGWRSRIERASEGAQFEAPLRFSLKN